MARLFGILMAAVVVLFLVAVVAKVVSHETRPLYPLRDEQGRIIPE